MAWRLPVPCHQGLSVWGLRQFSFQIVVSTDRDRDQMRSEPRLYQQLTDALLRIGYPADAVPFVHFRIESQETVSATTTAVGVNRAKLHGNGYCSGHFGCHRDLSTISAATRRQSTMRRIRRHPDEPALGNHSSHLHCSDWYRHDRSRSA
jgi:hypothetical protein